MAVTLSAGVLRRYSRFTLYNSPYTAHDHGCAVDLYPGDATGPDPVDDDAVPAQSPVAGEVLDVRTVTAPSRSYAAEEDHLILVDTGEHVARILHVDPAVAPGEQVAVGDSLGTLVRAGFFAPWVANHLHLGFRDPDADPYRAAGSLPLELDSALAIDALSWDGTGAVVAAGDTYALLDSPTHAGGGFAGLAVTGPDGTEFGVLDGGLPHYDGGGLLRSGTGTASVDHSGPVHLLGTCIGVADGRDVTWDAVTVRANGDPVRGIALAVGQDGLGVKLVGESVDLLVGSDVEVTVESGVSRSWANIVREQFTRWLG